MEDQVEDQVEDQQVEDQVEDQQVLVHQAVGIRAVGIQAVGIRVVGIQAVGIRVVGIQAVVIRVVGILVQDIRVQDHIHHILQAILHQSFLINNMVILLFHSSIYHLIMVHMEDI